MESARIAESEACTLPEGVFHVQDFHVSSGRRGGSGGIDCRGSYSRTSSWWWWRLLKRFLRLLKWLRNVGIGHELQSRGWQHAIVGEHDSRILSGERRGMHDMQPTAGSGSDQDVRKTREANSRAGQRIRAGTDRQPFARRFGVDGCTGESRLRRQSEMTLESAAYPVECPWNRARLLLWRKYP